jgi:type IV fimbrial biogenesis protein FimT
MTNLARGIAGANRLRGATALELAFVLVLFAVLLGMAVPSFTRLRQNAALSAAANQMTAALHYARSLAITRGVPIGLCQTQDGSHCLTAAGLSSSGFMVYVKSGEEVLRRFEIDPTLTLRATRAAITYWPAPRQAMTATFSFCDSRGVAAPRAVIVSQTGRPRMSRLTGDGKPLDCR